MSPIKSRKHPRPSSSSLATATLLTGIAIGSPLPASAEAADDGTTTLDRIDVHGMRIKTYSSETLSSPKFTQPLLDTPQTIEVIGADLFNEQGATTLTEALRNSPGVGTFYAGENGNTSTGDAIYMRGFDSSGSIFVDGMRDLGTVSRDVFNIEQIEVTKGPAGTDYGRTAPTGSINLVTKQPSLHDDGGASLSWGSDGQKRGTADFNHAIGAGSAFRINAVVQDSDVPGRDDVKNKRWGIAPSLAFGLGTATRVYVDLLHVRQDNVPDGGVPTIGLPGYSTPDPARPQIGQAPRVDPSNFYGTTSDHDDVTVDMATLRFEHDVSDTLRLVNTTRWGRNRQDYLLTSFMLSADPARFQTPDIDDPGTWVVARSLPTFKDQVNTLAGNQTNLRARFATGAVRHDLSAGIEFMREELESHGIAALNGTAWPAANLYHPDPHVAGLEWGRTGARGDGRTDTAAAYVFDTLEFGERWLVTGGVRFDHYKTDFHSLVACGGRGAPACGSLPAGSIVTGVDADTSDTLFNWKLGVVYKPTEDGSVYANFATSQQPPGGGSLELSSSANNANNPVFDPQKARSAEIGAKWSLLDDALLLTAAVYDTRLTNEIVQDPVDLQYYQVGEKRVRGIELGMVGKISDAWSVSAGYTTMDTEVVSGSVVTSDGSTDLPYTPKSAFTAWTTWELPWGLTLGGGARYSGEMKRGSDGAVGTPTHTEAYWVFDAVAGYAVNDHFDLRLNVYNLFDKDYVASINKSGYRYVPGTPRTAMLTANFRF